MLTTNDAARVVGVKRGTILQNIRRGNLVAEKHGRDWVIQKDELRRWAQSRKIKMGRTGENLE